MKNQKDMKLQMVSVRYKGCCFTLFVTVPRGERPTVTQAMLDQIGVRRGDCFGVG